MNNNYSILVVEDEPALQDMLCFTIERGGYSTQAADSAEQALEKLNHQLPELIIIDWMLPGISGIDLIRRLRGDELTNNIPLIMLTAKGEETDKLMGLDSGADDYLTKPFSTKELLARIRALLRRTKPDADGLLEIDRICLDTQYHQLRIDGKGVPIGPTEFRLLECLMRSPDRAFSRDQLLDRVWSRTTYIEERTVDVHVLRLRKLLTPYACSKFIETVRGVGYRFNKHPPNTAEDKTASL